MREINKLRWCSVLTMALCLWVTSCNKSADQSATQEQSSDPAQANLAQAGQQPGSQAPTQQPAAPAQQPQSSDQSQPSYQPEPAPASQSYDQNYAADTDSGYGAQPVEADQPPPPLPDYSQPECPGENYMWTPGYWGYASEGYYWVPGAWVLAPYVGALWTPAYWAFGSGRYHWHRGYWASHVGYYGGINYGYGYVGRGYEGGYWNRGAFDYNRSVNNVNVNVIHNVYNYRVNSYTSTVSYNGGPGGLNVRPTAAEAAVLHEQRIAPVPAQVQHMQQAAANRAQFAAVNHGRPETLVAARPLATAYKAPAPHAAAVPGVRTLPKVSARQEAAPTPQTHAETQPNARPGERAETRTNPAAHGAPPNVRQGNPGQPVARTPQPTPVHPEEHPAARAPQPAPAHPEEHPAARAPQPAPAHPEEHPAARAPQPPPAAPATHGAPPNRPTPEARPAPPPPRQETKPAPAQRSAPPAHEQKKSGNTKDTKDTEH